MCLALLDAEGEVSGIHLAKAILERYAKLSAGEKLTFFDFLNEALEVDLLALEAAVQTYAQSRSTNDYRDLSVAAEPRRQELLRRLNQPTGATRALVQMRTDLLSMLRDAPALSRIDLDFQHLLRSWFNRGFLVLRRINWDTPASILEKIVEYEAVHAIESWNDLRRRLYPTDRRCFAYFHPVMPDEPLIFVEVALTLDIPDSIQKVLADDRAVLEAQDTNVAVFYSISNCQTGLKGISFGNLLIKQVVDELRQELPQLSTFVTLSPIPRLMPWLEQQDDEASRRLLHGTATQEEIQAVASDYLLNAKTARGDPFDPVARFHLGNGAQIHAVHPAADISENGLRQSGGAMVNYHYDLALIERNHERFVQDGEISTAPSFREANQKSNARKQKGRSS
ncbi:malonyl-CoA decarboxylase [Ruegeria marina]|uniref:Malonyl-CoA decarboxylase n=1 Tax=Ruegeria marina TaxID=639004 RepID=A0A1G7EKB2_9RHOB|nr:malonyl-CoA decarboxylase [Ruegeria marina]SDE64123.1 malonyl-CoA decarboxylase [Ruegeria marina]